MNAETTFLFITFCGLIGIFLRRNLLNILVSFLQILCGISGLIMSADNFLSHQELSFYFILVFAFALILFIYAVVLLLIRRRSTVQVNELTELRG